MQVLNNIGDEEFKVSVTPPPFQFEQANLVKNILSIVKENDIPVSQVILIEGYYYNPPLPLEGLVGYLTTNPGKRDSC